MKLLFILLSIASTLSTWSTQAQTRVALMTDTNGTVLAPAVIRSAVLSNATVRGWLVITNPAGGGFFINESNATFNVPEGGGGLTGMAYNDSGVLEIKNGGSGYIVDEYGQIVTGNAIYILGTNIHAAIASNAIHQAASSNLAAIMVSRTNGYSIGTHTNSGGVLMTNPASPCYSLLGTNFLGIHKVGDGAGLTNGWEYLHGVALDTNSICFGDGSFTTPYQIGLDAQELRVLEPFDATQVRFTRSGIVVTNNGASSTVSSNSITTQEIVTGGISVSGGIRVPVVVGVESDNYQLTTNHCVVIVNPTNEVETLIRTPANPPEGMLLTVRNQSGSFNTVLTNSYGYIVSQNTDTYINVNCHGSGQIVGWQLIASGTNWYVIGKYRDED